MEEFWGNGQSVSLCSRSSQANTENGSRNGLRPRRCRRAFNVTLCVSGDQAFPRWADRRSKTMDHERPVMRRCGALRPVEGPRIYNDLATNTRVSPKATWSNLNPARTSSRSPARVVVMAAQVEPSGRLGRPTNKNSAPTRTHGDPQDVTRGNITVLNVPLNLQCAPGKFRLSTKPQRHHRPLAQAVP
jgi:hypothetical protein